MDKWIHNMSKDQLTQTEHSELSQGLTFATPNNEKASHTKNSSSRQNWYGKKTLQNERAGILKKAKLPPETISR